jgi:hypothetical protein
VSLSRNGARVGSDSKFRTFHMFTYIVSVAVSQECGVTAVEIELASQISISEQHEP